jgi:hypothetical protein
MVAVTDLDDYDDHIIEVRGWAWQHGSGQWQAQRPNSVK